MSLYNAIVWLDHDQAHIFQFNAKEGQELVVRSRHRRDRMLHPNHRGKEQKADMTAYFKAIEEALNEVDEFVIVGPLTAKFEFEKHLGSHAKAIFLRLLGTEDVVHANDEDILKVARRYFKLADSMPSSSYIVGL